MVQIWLTVRMLMKKITFLLACVLCGSDVPCEPQTPLLSSSNKALKTLFKLIWLATVWTSQKFFLCHLSEKLLGLKTYSCESKHSLIYSKWKTHCGLLIFIVDCKFWSILIVECYFYLIISLRFWDKSFIEKCENFVA